MNRYMYSVVTTCALLDGWTCHFDWFCWSLIAVLLAQMDDVDCKRNFLDKIELFLLLLLEWSSARCSGGKVYNEFGPNLDRDAISYCFDLSNLRK